MIVKFLGHEFNFDNPIITIGSISFDISKAEEWTKDGILTHEGELARLYLNVLGWNESIKKDFDGDDVIIPARIGIDLSISTYDEIFDYLNTTHEKMSESLKELLRKVMKIKDPTKFKNEINLVSAKMKTEYTLIDNEEQDIESLGSCGGGKLGKVRLDVSDTVIPKSP